MPNIPDHDPHKELLYMEGGEYKLMSLEEARERGFLMDPADAAPPTEPPKSTSVEMWKARAVMKVTPWQGGTLYEAVIAGIESLPEPDRTIAQEALAAATLFDLNGALVPMLITLLGVDEATVEQLMEQARQIQG